MFVSLEKFHFVTSLSANNMFEKAFPVIIHVIIADSVKMSKYVFHNFFLRFSKKIAIM